LVLVCPDLLSSVEDDSYGIRGGGGGVVYRITVSTICLQKGTLVVWQGNGMECVNPP
jgi:hypothetical protein